ncbi:MAG: oligosaccharide flippase family protein [Chitinophagaceae bacterium]|nr:oligosaccharide flippase family protein [Chitinophagaceae bacterium]
MPVIITRIFFKNFFSLGVVQVINSLLQLVVIPFVISRIGIVQFGVIAVAQVVVNYLATFTDYHFNQSSTKTVSLNVADTDLLSSLFSKVYIIKSLLITVALIVLLLLYFLLPFVRENFVLYILAYVYVIGYALQPIWFLQGVEKMQWIAAASLASRIIFVVLILLFINNSGDSWQYLFFMGMGLFFSGVTSIFFVYKKFNLSWRWPALNEILIEIKAGWHITASNISMNIMQYGNLFILRIFTNDFTAGYFSVAERVFFTMKYALSIFSQAVFPGVCRAASQSKRVLFRFFKKFFTPFFALVIVGCTLVWVIAPQVLSFFINDANPESIFILRMLCIILPVICLNLPPALVLLAYEKNKTYAAVFTAGLLVNILANVILSSAFESVGTVRAIFITELFITGLLWLFLKRVLIADSSKTKKGFHP